MPTNRRSLHSLANIGRSIAASEFRDLEVELRALRVSDALTDQESDYLLGYYGRLMEVPDFFHSHFLEKSSVLAGVSETIVSDDRSGDALALDVGCGPGTQSILMARCGLKVLGVDLDATAIRVATVRAQRRDRVLAQRAGFSVMDAVRHLEETDSRYDLIWSQQAIAQFPEPVTFVKQCAGALKAGGWLVLSEGNPRHPLNRIRFAKRRLFRAGGSRSAGGLSALDLKRILGACGLVVQGTAYYGVVPPALFKAPQARASSIKIDQFLRSREVASHLGMTYLAVAVKED